MELYGSLIANEGSGGGGGTVDVPIKSISVNGSGVAPVNKNVNIDVPTKTSELQNDSNFASTGDIPTKTSQLENDSSFVTESDLTAKNYADKTYVGEQIAQSEHLKREIVTVLPEPSVADEHTIYMLKDDSVQGNDKYKEYMLIEGVVQCVGDTSVDLTDYAKTADIPTELPANGGNADTVNNHTVESDVPVDAKFTDTVYDDTEVKGSIEELSSNLDGLGYGENGAKNLFEDEIKWVKNIPIIRGTKSVSDGKITLTATSNDCYTENTVSSWKNNGIKTIPCKPNKEYTFSWECEGDSEGSIYIFENGSTKSMSYTINKSHKLLVTTSADAEYLIVRVGVRKSGTSITYWNFQLEEGDTATPYKPYIPSIKMLAEEVNAQNESLRTLGKCKNLLNSTFDTCTHNGVTFTKNNDGTCSLSGSRTDTSSSAYISFITDYPLEKGRYKLTGALDENNNIRCIIKESGSGNRNIYDYGKGAVLDISKPNTTIKLMIISIDDTSQTRIVKPMITTDLNATYDDFVPYTGDGETLAHDVAKIKNDLGSTDISSIGDGTVTGAISVVNDKLSGLTFSASGTTLSITDGTHTWTLEANN